MIADSFGNCYGTAVSYSESLSDDTSEIGLASCCAIQVHVACNNTLFSFEAGILRRINDDLAAGEALTDVVVGVAFYG